MLQLLEGLLFLVLALLVVLQGLALLVLWCWEGWYLFSGV